MEITDFPLINACLNALSGILLLKYQNDVGRAEEEGRLAHRLGRVDAVNVVCAVEELDAEVARRVVEGRELVVARAVGQQRPRRRAAAERVCAFEEDLCR